MCSPTSTGAPLRLPEASDYEVPSFIEPYKALTTFSTIMYNIKLLGSPCPQFVDYTP